MPTFAFPRAPGRLAAPLPRTRNAPLPAAKRPPHGFGEALHARSLSIPDRSTGELLRTL